ncbi:GGDEF domain-containing protein [Actinoplanes sp. NPDC049599]|uniref:GGDEF domain-containing protein n=1 Tax=Actinoplanes sp. NPDC049599 TaxID=3363903 RepID=UPI0037A1ACC3
MDLVVKRWSNGRAWRIMLSGAMGVAANAIALAYAAMTWGGPHRDAMVTLYAAGALIGVAVIAAARNLTAARGNRLVMLAVGVVSTVIVGVAAVLDGGAGSPAALGFFAPSLLFAVTCPPRVMLGMEAMLIAVYAAAAWAGTPPPPGYIFVNLGGMLVIVAVCSLQAAMVAAQRRQLHELAQLDPLTGALNRRGMEQKAVPLLDRATTDHPVSVLCLDFDDFKAINDTQGHAAGDQLLRWAVQTALLTMPMDALVARTGGDEFIIVLPGHPAAAAAAAGDHLRSALAARVGVSWGAVTAPDDGADLDALIAVADERLYADKTRRRAGRGILTG